MLGRNVSSQTPRRRASRGAALIEFVVILPILLMVVFGIWEFGRIFDAWLVSTNASREGARYGAESTLTGAGLQDFVRGKVQNYLSSGYGSGRVDLGVTHTRPNPKDVHIPPSNILVEELPDNEVRVVVRANVDIWAPAVAPLMGRDVFSVDAWTAMRK